MAKQKFSITQREALFRAHDGKCFYTRVALNISNFQIDHIIPEKFLADQERLAEIKATLQLPDDFNLLGFENLVPAAPERNLQKSDVVFNEHDARYYLALARKKIERVDEEIKKIENRNTGAKVITLLQEALENEKLLSRDLEHLSALLTAVSNTLTNPVLDCKTAIGRITQLKEFKEFDAYVKAFSRNGDARAAVAIEEIPDLSATKGDIKRSWRIVIGEDTETRFLRLYRIAIDVDSGSMKILGRDVETWIPFENRLDQFTDYSINKAS